MRSLESASPAGPFTATCVVASNLSVGSGVIVIFAVWVHLTASARFRVRAPGPVSGRLSTTAGWRTGIIVVVSRRLSAAGIRFSVILHPPGSCARLTVGLPGCSPDLDGVSVFRTHELRPGWAPSVPRGRRCSSRPRPLPGRRLPLRSGQSLHPAGSSHRRGSCLTRHLPRVHTCSPVRSSPCLWPPGWNGPPLGFPPSFAPRRPGADDARRGGDRPSSTDLELLAQLTSVDLQSGSSLVACDLASHVAKHSHDRGVRDDSYWAIARVRTWTRFIGAGERSRRPTGGDTPGESTSGSAAGIDAPGRLVPRDSATPGRTLQVGAALSLLERTR
jgi:hypothetical protein